MGTTVRRKQQQQQPTSTVSGSSSKDPTVSGVSTVYYSMDTDPANSSDDEEGEEKIEWRWGRRFTRRYQRRPNVRRRRLSADREEALVHMESLGQR